MQINYTPPELGYTIHETGNPCFQIFELKNEDKISYSLLLTHKQGLFTAESKRVLKEDIFQEIESLKKRMLVFEKMNSSY
ncbi:MAG: hypothetical protein KME22_10270 [Hassallia sp. WJT32-NPBG1]|jgi:alpha-acetolactate decarboxylase|nr:hypothetical protein [Hassallia sp. WJT32-NPBG1]